MRRGPDVLVDAFAGFVPGGGGIGRYVRDLTHALTTLPDAPPARFLVTRNYRDAALERFGPERLVVLPIAWRHLALGMMVGARLRVPFDGFYGNPAVIHSPLGYGPTFRRSRLINHIHDLTYLEHPEWHTGKTAALLSVTAPSAARAASVVLSHSEFIRGRVVDVFGVPRERTVVIPPPLGHDFHPIPAEAARQHVRRRFGLEGDFILHVGTLEPRKNHVRLFEAFEQLRRDGFPGPLILVGRDGWRMGPILQRLEASPVAAHIRRVTDADDHDLVALYGACTMNVFHSLEEGFGMPLLESMACGAPCVISDHAALLELADGCAIAVPALDVDALTGAMRSLWREPHERARLAAAGPARAEGYAFPRWAKRIFTLYRSELAAAAGASPPSRE